ncbi:hypothetical protein, partial [Streptomyces sp. WM6386]|uniref:hypothetical protein n=1 Tax=Streptomyces sp. WM6386 TaxID=1415558 RepID=UPI000619C5AF
PESYPTTLFPEISEFAKNAPYEYDGARVLVYGETISRKEEYHKLAVYFRRPASFWNNLPLAATFEQLVAGLARRAVTSGTSRNARRSHVRNR